MHQTSTSKNIRIIIAPGRVNLLGEHVDYNDGPVLPIAIDRTMKLAFQKRQDHLIKLSALDLGLKATFSTDSLQEKKDIDGHPLPSFALYPASVFWAFQQAGYKTMGLEAAYTANIPIGSGLSSSAAVEMGFARAIQTVSALDIPRMELVKLTMAGENNYVGVKSGLMDQFTSLFGVEDHALYLDTGSLTWEAVPLPPEMAIIVANSMLPRKLTGSAYNNRKEACEQAVAILKKHLPAIKALGDISPDDFSKYADTLPPVIRKRAQHVIEECARVKRAVTLLKTGDTKGFGHLMVEGHRSLRDLYEVSLPELDLLVEAAMEQPSCFGARLTGAGFGGCTVNLVQENESTAFIKNLQKTYFQKTGKKAVFYRCKAAKGTHLIPSDTT